MAVPLIKNSFVTGEVAPSIFGRTDLARYHTALSTCRNFWPTYRGPAYSRAGTAFVGFSKQTGRAYPPRLIPFQFSIGQGLALEFGNYYMRVVYDGAFVTQSVVAITGVTNASPGVVSAAASGGQTASPIDSGIVSSYAPGDSVTLAGGVYTAPAVLSVLTTKLLALSANPLSLGSGYVPADTIHLTGGTQTTPAVVTATTTQVASAAIAAGGSGGTNGTQTVTGTTGTGTKFQASVTVAGGAITAVLSILVGGAYTVNPTTLSAEPVVGAGLAGATLSVAMGVGSLSVTTAGVFTANPASGAFTQASTSGGGSGAAFTYALMGPNTVSFASAGAYTTFPANPVTQASSSGTGRGATFTVSSVSVAPFSNGDWVYVSGVEGMTELNGGTYVVGAASTGGFALFDVYGNAINTTGFGAYAGGGTAARVYTLTTPWAEEDLKWLKFTQSADTMSICCVNQQTGAEYAPQDLARAADDNWTLSSATPAPSIGPPPFCSLTATAIPAGAAGAAYYQYVVTAVSPVDGTESIASPVGGLGPASDISLNAGTVTVTWGSVATVNQYNVYKATPSFNTYAPSVIPPPVGALFGFAGQALGTQFIDTNVVPDFSQVPPVHQNPFARGQIIGVNPVSPGSGYTYAFGVVTTTTGGEAILTGITVNGGVVAWLIQDNGENYAPTDTVTVYGNGSGATATLVVGPESGTYPGVPGYFQERRAYGNSINDPDTYWMSQPGSYTNFDTRNPTIASDAITGTPWGQQVNGIQWMIMTSGGLLVMTGLSAWLLAGVGSFATSVQAISPSTQDAVPQAFSGCSAVVPPIKINYDVVYIESKDSRVYDLPYQLYALSEPIDLTEVSPHLFAGYTIREAAWCEQPNKLYWAVRDDGVLLSMTYYKTQQISGWARHDTNGSFVSVCSVVEPPVDALYLAVQRTIGANTAYTIERMDNRIWPTVESAWCVDCGLALAQPAPDAAIVISSPRGLGSLTGVTGLVGGAGYSAATTATVVDRALDEDGNPLGSGAVPSLTIIGGVITTVTFAGGSQGSGYQQPEIIFNDPAGSAGGVGASARAVLNNAATATSSPGVFSTGSVGDVIRASGGIAVITGYVSATTASINVLVPFIIGPYTTGAVPIYPPGAWTLSAPVTTISGLEHLIGATVTGLADGNVIPPTVVNASGQITLATAASAVTVGLGFQCQLQDVPLDAGNPTVQGQRKKVSAVTVRLEASRGVQIGVNQPDGSTLSPAQLAPGWQQMQTVPDTGPDTPNFPLVPYNALATPLRTGDVRVATQGGWETPGQVCVQQNLPLPCQVVALVSELLGGDTPQTQAQPKGKGK